MTSFFLPWSFLFYLSLFLLFRVGFALKKKKPPKERTEGRKGKNKKQLRMMTWIQGKHRVTRWKEPKRRKTNIFTIYDSFSAIARKEKGNKTATAITVSRNEKACTETADGLFCFVLFFTQGGVQGLFLFFFRLSFISYSLHILVLTGVHLSGWCYWRKGAVVFFFSIIFFVTFPTKIVFRG